MLCKVLVVDDEPAVRDLFSDLLKKEKCKVECVSSGEETLDLINKENFDIVLLDIKLLGMSGFETLKKIKEIRSNLAVIMITGFGDDEELIAKSKEYGCSGYIGKNMPILQMLSNFKSLVKMAKKKK